MLPGYKCSFCGEVMADSPETHYDARVSFGGFLKTPTIPNAVLHFFKCPNCLETSIYCVINCKAGISVTPLRPNSEARLFPQYIPDPIRKDYEEACAIVHLSPKAAATLARRCLQGMIRDFWGITKSRLVDEISELQEKIPASQWKVIDSVRRIGNIGAHMEKDVNLIVDIEPDEARKLLRLIELLMEKWYIARHDEEQLYNEIVSIDQGKNSANAKTP